MSPSLATVGPSVYWYLTRGSGAVSLVLLTASVVIGIAGAMRVSGGHWPRFAVETVHRDVSLTVVVFLLIHIATSVLDSFAPISLTAAVIPFGASYRPLWLGLGALSFDLILALTITSLARRRLGYQTWRAVHWLAYASWPVAVLHGLGTGSDTKLWWMLALTAACVALVAAAIGLRLARGESTPPGLRGPAIALSLIVPVAIAGFTLLGPLEKGWAKRAGTPATLLAQAAPVRVVRTGTPVPGPAAALKSFTAKLSGRVAQKSASGGALVDLDLRLGGGARGRLRVRLAGAPIPGGGLSMTGSQVDLLEAGRSSALTGQISSLAGQNFVAKVTGGGSALTLNVRLNIDQQTGTVSGQLNASAGRP
ncbi:MAG: ferric reductase-like transmembrane domain-containing protein [Solirubrobacteraceae bacterium]